jgi:uncharacterized protein YktB (UPF0637 family)
VQQIQINFEAGPAEAYETCREYVQSLVHQQGRLQKSIAADMDLSPSHLSRKAAQSPDDSMKFTLDDLEKFIEVTGDIRPLHYLIEKFITEKRTKEQIEKEIERLRGLL